MRYFLVTGPLSFEISLSRAWEILQGSDAFRYYIGGPQNTADIYLIRRY